MIDDCVRILEEEVSSKAGLSGKALRAGFRGFKRLQPGIVRGAFERLLPLFVPVVDPHWDRARSSGDPHGYFRDHGPAVADGLLDVTDRLADRSTHRGLTRLYRSMRGRARPHVIAAVVRIPELIEAHLDR